MTGHYALLKQDRAGDWYFVERAANHATVTTSESYASKAGARRAAFQMGLPLFEHDDRGRLVLCDG